MKISKFSRLLNPREERLPAKTGIGGRIKPLKSIPLVNPKVLLSNNARFRHHMKQFSITDGKALRAESLSTLRRMTDTVNKHLENFKQYRGLRFSVNEEAGKNIVTIRDTRTGEVVKTLPSESLVHIAANLRAKSGILADKEG